MDLPDRVERRAEAGRQGRGRRDGVGLPVGEVEDRPVEAPQVDDTDQENRQDRADSRTQREAHDPHPEGLEQGHAGHLPRGEAQGPQDPEVAPPLDEQGQQGPRDPEEGDDDCHDPHGARHGEGAVEDLEDVAVKLLARRDGQAPRGGAGADVVEDPPFPRLRGVDEDGDAVDRPVAVEGDVGGAVHHDEAVLRRVVVEDALDAQVDGPLRPLEGHDAAGGGAEAPGKALRDDDVAALDGLPVPVAALDPAEPREALQHAGLDGGHVDRPSAVGHLRLPVGVDAAHPGDAPNLLVEPFGDLHVRGVRDVQVAAKLGAHPPDEGLAEAADHGAQADREGEGHHEGGHGDARPTEVADDVARRDPAREAAE